MCGSRLSEVFYILPVSSFISLRNPTFDLQAHSWWNPITHSEALWSAKVIRQEEGEQ